jgi:hypothetical protein
MSRGKPNNVSPGQMPLGLVDDPIAIRDLLVTQLRASGHDGRLVPEMGLCQGDARIDLAAIGDRLDGYEIKSDRDDLRRLPNQVATYGQVFDRLTLVASERHIAAASSRVPDWWGLSVVNADVRTVEGIRLATPNPLRDPVSIARLLWRDEAAAIMMARTGKSQRSTRPVLWQQLAETVPTDELRALVCHYLRSRADWRAAG